MGRARRVRSEAALFNRSICCMVTDSLTGDNPTIASWASVNSGSKTERQMSASSIDLKSPWYIGYAL